MANHCGLFRQEIKDNGWLDIRSQQCRSLKPDGSVCGCLYSAHPSITTEVQAIATSIQPEIEQLARALRERLSESNGSDNDMGLNLGLHKILKYARRMQKVIRRIKDENSTSIPVRTPITLPT